ncbi:MAG: phage portal protein [Monoglobales bacterium]
MEAIRKYLKSMGYSLIGPEYYSQIHEWLKWYSGKVPSFHEYSQFNGKKSVKRSRCSLGMSKKVCEDWADLLLNEKTDIRVSNEEADEFLKEVLERNNFRVRSNRLLEITYAMGTGAFVEYYDDKGVAIDYIRADMIYPLSWDNGEITECAFASEKVMGGSRYIYLNMHIKENGCYKIINRLFLRKKNGQLEETELPDGVAAEFSSGSEKPLYQIITPNIVNNFDPDNPMGISIFANSLDILQGIDLVYDSYQNEFRLGKKRILIPAGMAHIHRDDTGITPIFDDNDTEFYVMHDKSLGELKEINMELRADPHEKALKKNLDLLSAKCGLGSGRYSYEKGRVKTATEVISDKDELYQSIRKNEIIIRRALTELADRVCFLGGFENSEISTYFDDSIIEDTATIAERAMKELEHGIIDKIEYFVKVYNLTENQALDLVEKMKSREAV